MLAFIIHYGLHLLLPFSVAFLFFKPHWPKAWLVMMLGMLIDIDHLWANPIYDPERCSVGFHTFHTWPFLLIYFILILPKKTRWWGLGLSLHILTDIIDCMQRNNFSFLD